MQAPKLNMSALLAKAREQKQREYEESLREVSLADKLGAGTAQVQVQVQVPAANPSSNPSSKIAELRARLAAQAAVSPVPALVPATQPAAVPLTPTASQDVKNTISTLLGKRLPEVSASASTVGMHGESITYNTEQEAFISLISSGESCVLIGPAGTGKTTCSKGGVQKLIHSGKVGILQADGHKHIVSGSPGILIVSYTRRAVNNIRKVQSEDMKQNCITSHKLLEYSPVECMIEDTETGTEKKSMTFEPLRNRDNPLPTSIHTIIVEEASMLSIELYNQICDALLHKVQWVFIGDIQQLPPVFGSAILGFKLLELPVVELTQVYRQALESPIIRLAHRILSGKPIPAAEYPKWKEEGKLTLHPWKKKLHADAACATLGAFFKAALDSELYDIEEDVILIPYNESCGTLELNRIIANHLARKRNAMTFEVMAGFHKHYFSVGDRVLVDKEEGEIVDIYSNPTYAGKGVQHPSRHLDYWGHNHNQSAEIAERRARGVSEDVLDSDIDAILESMGETGEGEQRKLQSSHTIVVNLLDSGKTDTLSSASKVNGLIFSYALTVHKAQGSEWRKVFLCLHQSHATMLQRELLYTGVTRAREELYVICEPESFTKGIISQKIRGNTLAEKAEFFKGKVDSTSYSYIRRGC